MRRRGSQAAQPLWNYSLSLYAQPGVEAACLALQAHGADVNLLLACCWLGGEGRRLEQRRLRRLLGASAQWQAQVVVPLRQARRALKRPLAVVPEADRLRLRQRVAAAELEAERLEQLLLAHELEELPARAGRDASADNLRRLLALSGIDAGAGDVEPHLQVLLAAAAAAAPSN